MATCCRPRMRNGRSDAGAAAAGPRAGALVDREARAAATLRDTTRGTRHAAVVRGRDTRRAVARSMVVAVGCGGSACAEGIPRMRKNARVHSTCATACQGPGVRAAHAQRRRVNGRGSGSGGQRSEEGGRRGVPPLPFGCPPTWLCPPSLCNVSPRARTTAAHQPACTHACLRIVHWSTCAAKSGALDRREDSSLGALSARFVEFLESQPNHESDYSSICEFLAIPKRRLYDVINVLEGIGLLEKKDRNTIAWRYVMWPRAARADAVRT
ncbi:hypothetical protein EON62_00250 [archaeon]|nr:MAG: hypothetical protein EON62_00250 [archaeon]